jgi:hypothetical protein
MSFSRATEALSRPDFPSKGARPTPDYHWHMFVQEYHASRLDPTAVGLGLVVLLSSPQWSNTTLWIEP